MHHFPDVDANPDLNLLFRQNSSIPLGQCLLNLDGTAHRPRRHWRTR